MLKVSTSSNRLKKIDNSFFWYLIIIFLKNKKNAKQLLMWIIFIIFDIPNILLLLSDFFFSVIALKSRGVIISFSGYQCGGHFQNETEEIKYYYYCNICFRRKCLIIWNHRPEFWVCFNKDLYISLK